jgi:preprotein translocase subunit SecE
MSFFHDTRGELRPEAIIPLVVVAIVVFVVFVVPLFCYGLDHWFHYVSTWHWTGSLHPGPPLLLEKQ